MVAIFLQTIRNKRIAILAFCIAGVLIALMYVSLFPTFAKQGEQFNALMKTFPKEVMKAFNVDSMAIMFNSIEGFFSVEDFGMMWPIMTAFLVSGIAIGAGIAGEVEKGTIETVLSLPVSRRNIFLGKYFAGVAMFAAYCVITIFSVPLFALLFHIDVQFGHFAIFLLLAFLFGWALFGIAMLLSSFFSDKGKASAIIVGLLVAMYAANIVSGLQASLDKLKYVSFFHYFAPLDPLVNGKVDMLSITVFAGVAIISSTLALWQWQRRDVAV